MYSRNLIFSLAFIFLVSCSDTDNVTSGGDQAIAGKVDSIMQIMTIEEKIGQLNMPGAGDITTGLATNTGIAPKIKQGNVGALLNIRGIEKIREAQRLAVEESRLGIPLIFAMDVIHGFKTLFPIPLGLTSCWNMEMIEETARTAAEEATSEGIMLTFSPVADISRDPRWGRISEGAGEDPFLGSAVARAMVNGYQGEDLSADNTLMACVKHFALYGAPDGGRDYNTVDMSRLRMYNDYFPPYRAAVEAGAGSAMAAFNDVDAVPATGSRWLMTEVLRKQWGFEGFVVTDYTGINEIVEHGVGNLEQSAVMALQAGIDMDMIGESYLNTLKESLEEGKISTEDIDRAVRRVLTAKFKLGLFDDPYKYINPGRSDKVVFSDEHKAFARRVAGESCVLLKNENNTLPLAREGTIAVIGPLVDNARNMAGTWSVNGDFDKCVSLLDGVREAVGSKAKVLHAKGANIYADPDLEARVSTFGKPTNRDERPAEVIRREAVEIAQRSDVIIAGLGEAAESSGESSSMSDISMPEVQVELLKELIKTGKPVVLVLFNGRPLAINWSAENVPAILDAWFLGSEAGNAIADVLFGDVNPSGKLPVTFPQSEGQIPLFYSMKSTGRPLPQGNWFQKFRSNYLDVPNAPLFPFGYGLSYSVFQYSDIRLSDTIASGNDSITATVTVTNESDIDGKEVVQLYIHDVVGENTRPNKELKGFKKVLIAAGESVDVSFEITTDLLKYYKYDPETNYKEIIHQWEPGEFEILIGTNSEDLKVASLKWTE